MLQFDFIRVLMQYLIILLLMKKINIEMSYFKNYWKKFHFKSQQNMRTMRMKYTNLLWPCATSSNI